DDGAGPEGALSREQLVEDDSEREDVASGVQRLSAHLLWRHVSGRAQHRARTGRRARRADGGIQQPARLGHPWVRLGDAEVEELYLTHQGEEGVLRLEVAVDEGGWCSRGGGYASVLP